MTVATVSEFLKCLLLLYLCLGKHSDSSSVYYSSRFDFVRSLIILYQPNIIEYNNVSVFFRFARFRDVREHVHNFSAVLAACLVLAFEDVSLTTDLASKVGMMSWLLVCVVLFSYSCSLVGIQSPSVLVTM